MLVGLRFAEPCTEHQKLGCVCVCVLRPVCDCVPFFTAVSALINRHGAVPMSGYRKKRKAYAVRHHNGSICTQGQPQASHASEIQHSISSFVANLSQCLGCNLVASAVTSNPASLWCPAWLQHNAIKALCNIRVQCQSAMSECNARVQCR